jgi:hypothetical protein
MLSGESTSTNKRDENGHLSVQQAGMVDDFLSKFLEVKVINFDTDEGNADNDTQDELKKK